MATRCAPLVITWFLKPFNYYDLYRIYLPYSTKTGSYPTYNTDRLVKRGPPTVSLWFNWMVAKGSPKSRPSGGVGGRAFFVEIIGIDRIHRLAATISGSVQVQDVLAAAVGYDLLLVAHHCTIKDSY